MAVKAFQSGRARIRHGMQKCGMVGKKYSMIGDSSRGRIVGDSGREGIVIGGNGRGSFIVESTRGGVIW